MASEVKLLPRRTKTRASTWRSWLWQVAVDTDDLLQRAEQLRVKPKSR